MEFMPFVLDQKQFVQVNCPKTEAWNMLAITETTFHRK